MTHKPKESDLAQYQKFKDAARKLETDESEENFDRMLKNVAKSAPPKDDSPKKASK